MGNNTVKSVITLLAYRQKKVQLLRCEILLLINSTEQYPSLEASSTLITHKRL